MRQFSERLIPEHTRRGLPDKVIAQGHRLTAGSAAQRFSDRICKAQLLINVFIGSSITHRKYARTYESGTGSQGALWSTSRAEVSAAVDRPWYTVASTGLYRMATHKKPEATERLKRNAQRSRKGRRSMQVATHALMVDPCVPRVRTLVADSIANGPQYSGDSVTVTIGSSVLYFKVHALNTVIKPFDQARKRCRFGRLELAPQSPTVATHEPL
nr:hypothetical protein CFP56_64594 [Quercus suber]